MTTPIRDFVGQLESEFGPMHRLIEVEYDVETDKKHQHGERNDLAQSDIASDRGSGNTYSLYLNHMPGIMVLDFDCKQECELYTALVARDALRVETNKGHHVYVRCTDAPIDRCRINAFKHCKGDIMYGSGNNVWETDSRVLLGSLQVVEWSEIEPHVQLSKSGKRKQPAPATNTENKPLPECLRAYLSAKYPTVQGCTYKLDIQTVSKRRGTQIISTETPIDC
jgi:hypothetical protein